MDKVIILGAGRGQIPLMEICKKYGCYVICISPEGNYPGFKIADEVIISDVRDAEYLFKLVNNMDVKAVLTDQLDVAVFSAAYLSEKKGLKGISTEVAKKFSSKSSMRYEANKLGIAVPSFFTAETVEEAILKLESEASFDFPVMIKPDDSDASRGVFKLWSKEDLREYFSTSVKFSHNKKVIIEQFITGKEYVVEAYTHNYHANNLLVGHRDYFNIPDTFIPSATVFLDAESANDYVETRMKETNKKLVEGFKLPFGITHAEYLYNEEQDCIYLVEIAARGGGVFISSDLVPAACGVNANDLLVRDVLGLPIENIQLKHGASAYFCYLTPTGIVTKIDGTDKVDNIPGVRKAYFDNVEIGMQTGEITNKSSRKGPILIEGNTIEDCYSVIEEVKKVLNIKVLSDDKEMDIIWN